MRRRLLQEHKALWSASQQAQGSAVSLANEDPGKTTNVQLPTCHRAGTLPIVTQVPARRMLCTSGIATVLHQTYDTCSHAHLAWGRIIIISCRCSALSCSPPMPDREHEQHQSVKGSMFYHAPRLIKLGTLARVSRFQTGGKHASPTVISSLMLHASMQRSSLPMSVSADAPRLLTACAGCGVR